MKGFEPFSFLFMADCQLGCYAAFSGLTETDVAEYADKGMAVRVAPQTEGFSWDASQLERAVAAANRLSPDFVVMGGDMVDDPRDDSQYAALSDIVSELEGPSTMHWVPGNHDVAFDTVAPTEDSLLLYRRRFGPDTYAFDHKGAVFVVVNTVVWDHPDRVPGAWSTQLMSLEQELDAARRRGATHLIVMGHHPLFTALPGEFDSYWNIPGERRHVIIDLFRTYGVETMFAGHWHRNGGGMAGDLEVVASGPVGYPLGADPSGFRIVDVTAGGVSHRYVALDEF